MLPRTLPEHQKHRIGNYKLDPIRSESDRTGYQLIICKPANGSSQKRSDETRREEKGWEENRSTKKGWRKSRAEIGREEGERREEKRRGAEERRPEATETTRRQKRREDRRSYAYNEKEHLGVRNRAALGYRPGGFCKTC